MLPNNPDKTKYEKAADPPPSWMLIPQTRACSLPLTEIPHSLRRSSGRCRRPRREGHRRAADQERRLSAGRHLPRNKMAPPLFLASRGGVTERRKLSRRARASRSVLSVTLQHSGRQVALGLAREEFLTKQTANDEDPSPVPPHVPSGLHVDACPPFGII